MASANFFINNPSKVEYEHKMEIEQAHNINHSNMIRNYIFSKRMNIFPFRQFSNIQKTLPNEFDSNLIIKNINEIILIFNKLHNLSQFITNNAEIVTIKNTILEYLKQIRKELSKENISLIDAKNIFNANIPNFIELLINDTYDPYIQIESLWIINNLIFIVAKYKNFISFDVKIIANSLIQYLFNIYKNKKNEGVKYTLGEKILRIFGNLIYIDNNLIELLLKNQIIPFIIGSLNSPVSSFRTTCLWLINKIIIIFGKLNANNYINLFLEKNAISNYKFILARLENKSSSFDETGELFWLFNELVKYNSSFLIPIFFSNANINANSIDFISLNKVNKDIAFKNFEFILNNCLSSKMIQACFRLISNLLIICWKDLKDEDLLSKLIDKLYLKHGVLEFINDILNSPKNKYNISLVKDILLLIFNLICLSQIKSSSLFKNGIVNLITNKDYQNDNEIMKLLFFIYYRILGSNYFSFEPNDENVIKVCLEIMERFKDDNSILIIFIDILFFYLKLSHIKIEENIEDELKVLSDSEKNIPIENLQIYLFKLSNYIKVNLSN